MMRLRCPLKMQVPGLGLYILVGIMRLSRIDTSTSVSLLVAAAYTHCPVSPNEWLGEKDFTNLENDEETEHVKIKEMERGLPTLSSRSSQCSFSTISNTTQLSTQECFSWTRHPLVQKNKKVVLSSFLLLLLGLVFVFVGVGLQVSPSPAVSSAIFFVPGLLLLIPGVYHVIFIYCAVRGRHGFQFFYLPYFDK